jgi:hypothetical protein
LSDAPDRPSPGPQTLVVRAAFVPEGKQPPAELLSTINPLRFPATLDPATGEITCDRAGAGFHGDVRAEWYPDSDQESDGDQESDDEVDQDDQQQGTGQKPGTRPAGPGSGRGA